MALLVRSIVVAVLCGVAIFGQLPTWLHIAGDDHAGHLSHQHAEDACSHSGHEGDATEVYRSPHDSSGHHSESCLICQSNYLPSGSGWRQAPLIVEIGKFSRIRITESTFFDLAVQSGPHSRGPPVRLI